MLISKPMIRLLKELVEKDFEKVLNKAIKEKNESKQQSLYNKLADYSHILKIIDKAL
jgi:hypothetical protein